MTFFHMKGILFLCLLSPVLIFCLFNEDSLGEDMKPFPILEEDSSLSTENIYDETGGSSEAAVAMKRDSFETLFPLLKSQVSLSDPRAKYKFGRVIGKGSKGVVVEAVHRFMGQKVAIIDHLSSFLYLFSCSNSNR